MKLLANAQAFIPPLPYPNYNNPIWAIKGLYGCDYYASPTGSPSNSGTDIDDPWNLQKALTSSLVNGKILGLVGGTYTGKFISTLNNALIRCSAFGVAIDGYVHTTLTNDMAAGTQGQSITFAVGNATAIKALYDAGTINSIIINGEALFITAISGNNITANRAASGSEPAGVAPAHTAGAAVRAAGNQLYIQGNNSTYIGLEILNSDPLRNFATDGGDGPRGNGIFVSGISGNTASGNTIANCYLHDNLNGIQTGSDSANTQVFGCILSNNGMSNSNGEPLGHGGYFENKSGFSYVYDNLFLNNFNEGFQCYGRTAAYPGGRVIGNVSANSGSPNGASFRVRNAIVGPEAQGNRIPDILMSDNHFVHPQNVNGGNMTFGYGDGVTHGTIQNSYFVGGGNGLSVEVKNTTSVVFTGNKTYGTNASGINVQSSQQSTNYNWNNNTYYATATNADRFGNTTASANQTFALWKSSTGYDANSTITTGALPTTVIVRPNAFETGRANIYVYAQGQTAVSVDLAQAGIPMGYTYQIFNAFNYTPNGEYVTSGIYAGAPITLPLNVANATSVVSPVGGGYTPTTTLPNFGAFILRSYLAS